MKTLDASLLIVCSLCVHQVAFACNQSTVSNGDRDLWAIHGCWSDYYLWQYKAYDANSDDWEDHGFYDACNVNKEYAKHWNAAYLMSYGLSDNPAFAFHSGAMDYQELSRARTSDEWHDGLRHQVTDDLSFFGQYVKRSSVVDLVQTSCLLYDPALASNANPASRGGDFVHEGTHAWQGRHGFKRDHFTSPNILGSCTVAGANCDYFYFHGVGAYAFGAMYQEDGTASRFHSPNQSQVEYLCDLADFPADWVPASVRISAASDASARASSRFINGPGYTCGSPRPW